MRPRPQLIVGGNPGAAGDKGIGGWVDATGGIEYRQCDVKASRGGVDVRRVLQGAGCVIPEVPQPSNGIPRRRTGEVDGERSSASGSAVTRQ